MIERASEIFDVKKNEISHFDVDDIFNGNNIEGYLCRHGDHRYGALLITRVNDEECEQIICATPKMRYPFSKDTGNFTWPDVQEIQAFDKLDGTNILAYHYSYAGNDYVSYKTRLTPVIKNSDFGSFHEMWIELLEDKKWIRELIDANPDYNLSFELVGSRNPISVSYDFPLDTSLLFGVRRNDFVIRPPTELNIVNNASVAKQFSCSSSEDLTALYKNLRSDLTAQNEGCEDMFNVEGMILYAKVVGEPSWRQFKLKSEQIEKIHWTAAGIIPRLSIWTTAVNSYEDNPNPDVEYVIRLLKEEFTDALIKKSMRRIERIVPEVRSHMKLVKQINEIWQKAKEQGFDVYEDKAKTFRWMSQFFDKGQMRKVGSIVLRQAGLL